jgi:hypothetical protein
MDHEEISKKLLTGDELILRGPSYAIYRPNNYCIFLGRLLKRERGYSHYQQVYSNYNNIFIFEHMPNGDVLLNNFFDYIPNKDLLMNCYNKRIFMNVSPEVCQCCSLWSWIEEDTWGSVYYLK